MIVPVETLYAAARAVGDFLYLVDRRHGELAITQRSPPAFPDWPADKVTTVAREALHTICKLGCGDNYHAAPGSAHAVSQIKLKNIAPTLAMQLERPGGMILVTGHYGNWEVGGFALARLGMPVVAIARPLDNPYVDKYLRTIREAAGLKIVDKGGALRPIPGGFGQRRLGVLHRRPGRRQAAASS